MFQNSGYNCPIILLWIPFLLFSFLFLIFGTENRVTFPVVAMSANKLISNVVYSSYIIKINSSGKVTFHCDS